MRKIISDFLCLAVGLGGVIHQEVIGKVSPELLIVYLVLIGTPGTLGLVSLWRGKVDSPKDTIERSSSSHSDSS